MPKVTSPLFPEIDMARITPVRLANAVTQPLLALRHCNEMHMIRHQAVGPDNHFPPRAPFCHEFAIDLIVPVAKEGFKPAVAPLSDMMWHVGRHDPRDTCHASKIA